MISLEPVKSLRKNFKIQVNFSRWIQSYQQRSRAQPAEILLHYKEQQSRKGIQVRGGYVLLMFEGYFKTSEEAGSLDRVEDLLGVVKVGDPVQDLRRFVNKWDATLAGMAISPEDAVLRDILLRQIRPSQLLKYYIEVLIVPVKRPMRRHMVFSISPWRTWLTGNGSGKTEIALPRTKVGGSEDAKAAPAKGDGRGNPNRKGSPSRGR